MTPKEGSKLCIKMVGYGIRHDVVKAIQDDALNSLLNRLLAPTLKIVGDCESPMTVTERIEYVLQKEKALTEVKIRTNALAFKKANTDDPEFMVNDWAGGNIDDAYALGADDGEISLARFVKETLDAPMKMGYTDK